MATLYQKFFHMNQIRGMISSERTVFNFLYGQANANGIVDRLYTRTTCNACELQRTTLFDILRSLETKGFIKARTRRTSGEGDGGAYVSSSYELHMERVHPSDDEGARAGKLILSLMISLLEIPTHQAERLDAYYSPHRRVQTVWCQYPDIASFFFERRSTLRREAKDWGKLLRDIDTPVVFEFLHCKGQVSTAIPQWRADKPHGSDPN